MSVSGGVTALDFSPRTNTIVTGGADTVIRLWHPGLVRGRGTEPTVCLVGHALSIVDVIVNDADQHIMSLSSSAVVRVWDLQTFTCLQVSSTEEEACPGRGVASERGVNAWNSLPHDTNFNSVASFKRSIDKVDFTEFLKVDFMSS